MSTCDPSYSGAEVGGSWWEVERTLAVATPVHSSPRDRGRTCLKKGKEKRKVYQRSKKKDNLEMMMMMIFPGRQLGD